jgi:hypothetical protein
LAIDDNSMNRHNHLSPREVVKSAKSERWAKAESGSHIILLIRVNEKKKKEGMVDDWKHPARVSIIRWAHMLTCGPSHRHGFHWGTLEGVLGCSGSCKLQALSQTFIVSLENVKLYKLMHCILANTTLWSFNCLHTLIRICTLTF